ncbi:GPN-loop GTPase 2 [Oratosquilla oratoria]|uniref:GPN-loop GTPase 2 n=1 Tax=Oratosquilla oratoria TaxID=337810 RepID=UPI003F75B2AF
MVFYGQVVLGPPGSGKTTYCKAVASLLSDLGRKVAIVNLDPANDILPYKATIDIFELVQVEEVMETQGVGPNGALVFCMEMLEKNMDWLIDKIKSLKDHYLIMDFPGQAELYTHHTMVKNVLLALEKAEVRLCAAYLVDAHYANDPGKFISALMLALNSMLQMEMPLVNILSKVDTVEKYGKLNFGLDFYTEVLDLDYLLDALEDFPVTKKFRKLNKAMAEVVTDYALVSFLPLSVDNSKTLINVTKAIDKANGYVFGSSEERNIQRLLSCAVGAQWEHDRTGLDRETFMDSSSGDGEKEEDEEEELLKMIARQNQGRVIEKN